MAAPVIRPFATADQAGVLDCILDIQRGEYGMAITAQDQPDLAAIPEFYGPGAGGFWVAEAEGRIVGTIALKDIGGGDGALRKMFVAAPWRGRDHGVAAALMATLLAHARRGGLARIHLGTAAHFLAAHRFYERLGFALIAPEALPPAFPRMAVDTRFYTLALA